MPFFRIALLCCAIFSTDMASAALRGRFLSRFRRKDAHVATQDCRVPLVPSSADMPYLELIRKHRTFAGAKKEWMIDRTATALWRTEEYKRMTYEIFGGSHALYIHLHRVRQAAVTFLRWGGKLDEAHLSLSPAGNLIVDLPVGAPSAAFLLMTEKRLTTHVADISDESGQERLAIQHWMMAQPLNDSELANESPVAHGSSFTRDAAE